MMEGAPDEGIRQGSPGAARPRQPQRPPAPPNLWILLGMTLLSLAIAIGVLLVTAI